MAKAQGGREFYAAQQVRSYGFDQLKSIFKSVDIIVTPTTAVTAPAYQSDAFPRGFSDVAESTMLVRFTFLANLLGLPAVSVPAGYDANKLPIGLQVRCVRGAARAGQAAQAMAWQYEEHVLLRVMGALEQGVTLQKPKGKYYSPLDG